MEKAMAKILAHPQYVYRNKGKGMAFNQLNDVLKRRYTKALIKFIKRSIPPMFRKHPGVCTDGVRSLYFTGRVGGHKTTRMYWHLVHVYISANIAWKSPMYPEGFSGSMGNLYKFIEAPDIFMEFKNTWGKGATTREADVLKRYRDCDWLYIDDLGAGSMGEWGVEVMYNIVNHRYKFELPIIVSSNYSLNTLKERIGQKIKDPVAGERIWRRLHDTCAVLEAEEV